MWSRTSTHSLFRFQDAFSDWVFISSADGTEQTDFVLVIFLAHSGMPIKTDGKFFSIVSFYV